MAGMLSKIRSNITIGTLRVKQCNQPINKYSEMCSYNRSKTVMSRRDETRRIMMRGSTNSSASVGHGPAAPWCHFLAIISSAPSMSVITLPAPEPETGAYAPQNHFLTQPQHVISLLRDKSSIVYEK